MSAATITEADIANFLHTQAVSVTAKLPEMRGIRINVGNYEPGHTVAISGYVRGEINLLTFCGHTIPEAVNAARKYIAAL